MTEPREWEDRNKKTLWDLYFSMKDIQPVTRRHTGDLHRKNRRCVYKMKITLFNL